MATRFSTVRDGDRGPEGPHPCLSAAPGGFSLLEVLVALAVLAIAVSSMLGLQARMAADSGALTDRVLAHFVAENRVAALRLAGTGTGGVVMDSGEEEQAGRRFAWRVERFPTPDPGVLRVEVTVSDTRGGRLAVLTSFIRGRRS